MGVCVNKATNFGDFRLKVPNVVLDGISVGVSRMEVIDEVSCC